MTQQIERLHFNKAVALIRELSNALEAFDAEDPAAPALRGEGLTVLIQLLGPMVPHLAEELWSRLGHATLLAETPWPDADPDWLAVNEVTVAVQVNGKLRATITLPKGADQGTAAEAVQNLDNIRRALAEKPVRRVIYVPDKLLNLVA